MKVLLLVFGFVAYSYAVVSIPAIELQAAAVSQHVTDTRDVVNQITQAVGDSIHEKVETVVDTKNRVTDAATVAVVNGVEAVQTQVTHVATTAGKTVQDVTDAIGGATQVALLPVQFAGNMLTQKYAIIADRLYQLVHPTSVEVPVEVPEETTVEVVHAVSEEVEELPVDEVKPIHHSGHPSVIVEKPSHSSHPSSHESLEKPSHHPGHPSNQETELTHTNEEPDSFERPNLWNNLAQSQLDPRTN